MMETILILRLSKGYLRDGGSIFGEITLNFSEVKWTINTNMEFSKQHLSINMWISGLHIQISNIHLCIVPGPVTQDAVYKRVYA